MNYILGSGKILVGNIIFIMMNILLLMYFLRKSNQKMQLKDLILVSFFIVIPLIANKLLAISLFAAGVLVMKIGFHQQLMAIGGTTMPLHIAVLSGIIFDVIGMMLFSEGQPYYGFTFNYVLCYLIGAIIYQSKFKISEKMIYGLIAMIGILVSIFAYFVPQIRFEKTVIKMGATFLFVSNRILLILAVWAFVALISLIVYFSNRKLNHRDENKVNQWVLIVLLIELFVNVGLVSLHLNVMYAIPIVASMIPRLIKAAVLLPVYMIGGYFLLDFVHRLKGNKQYA